MKFSFLVFSFLFAGLTTANAERYIVILEDGIDTHLTANQMLDTPSLSMFGNDHLDNLFALTKNKVKMRKELEHIGILIVDATELESLNLKKIRAVRSIERDFSFAAPTPIVSAQSHLISKITAAQTPWGIKKVRAPQAWKANGRGAGVRVLVLDTGVDRDHPDLEANFEKGKDFTGESNQRQPYPYFDSNGHGTHVAGTILGTGAKGVFGVAPKATLLSGRVCSTSCSFSAILAGVDWAVAEKVDVVNMSLGGPFPSSQTAYQRAENAGVTIVAATGNDGRQRISYPAGYSTTLAVGAIDQNNNRAAFSNYGTALDIVAPGVDIISSIPLGTGRGSDLEINTSGTWEQAPSTAMVGAGISSTKGEVITAGIGKPDDYLNIDVKGKIVLIERGEISFEEKAKTAGSNGAIGVIIYNNVAGVLNGTLNQNGGGQVVNYPVIAIDQAAGQELVKELNGGNSVQAKVGIVTNDYASMQGTSMASPHITGVVALVRAANPKLTPSEVRTVLRRTATPLTNTLETGAGLVDAEAAVKDALGRALVVDIP